jgi:hypothetical protein
MSNTIFMHLPNYRPKFYRHLEVPADIADTILRFFSIFLASLSFIHLSLQNKRKCHFVRRNNPWFWKTTEPHRAAAAACTSRALVALEISSKILVRPVVFVSTHPAHGSHISAYGTHTFMPSWKPQHLLFSMNN